jgi:membrane-associated phospholipid phosphatase
MVNRVPLGPLLALVLLLATSVSSRAATPPDSTAGKAPSVTPADALPHPPVPHLFTGRDLIFLGAAGTLTAFTMVHDDWLTDRAIEAENNPDQRRVAQFFQPLGRASYMVPASLGLYGAARLFNQPRLARRSGRVALAVTIATAIGNGIKAAAGRERPVESEPHSNHWKPFSGNHSFVSGHATTAFAAAAALDRETDERWVPYLVYPAATLVAWSRVHDRKHWTSDVVAGAALGGWTAWKTETFLAHHSIGVRREDKKRRSSLWIEPRDGGFAVVLARELDR